MNIFLTLVLLAHLTPCRTRWTHLFSWRIEQKVSGPRSGHSVCPLFSHKQPQAPLIDIVLSLCEWKDEASPCRNWSVVVASFSSLSMSQSVRPTEQCRSHSAALVLSGGDMLPGASVRRHLPPARLLLAGGSSCGSAGLIERLIGSWFKTWSENSRRLCTWPGAVEHLHIEPRAHPATVQ